MRTIIYIDGFNLYYGSLIRTSYKWLDIEALCKNILQSHHQIISIKYFTAKIRHEKGDKRQPERQNIYLRALNAHISNIEIHYGHFLRHKKWAELVNPISEQKTVRIWNTEEKGSDVNLALQLLNDSWLDKFDCAVVISNDSDLTQALSLVKEHHNKKIGLLVPGETRNISKQLSQYADFVKRIKTEHLQKAQLPNSIPGTKIMKPYEWEEQ